MSANISKQKREDLLAKIEEIRTFISSASQDENTANLLSYLSDLEKLVNPDGRRLNWCGRQHHAARKGENCMALRGQRADHA